MAAQKKQPLGAVPRAIALLQLGPAAQFRTSAILRSTVNPNRPGGTLAVNFAFWIKLGVSGVSPPQTPPFTP